MIMRNGQVLFNIGEASRMVGVSEKTLRYYDNHGLVAAAWKDPENGYRYYDLETIYLVETRMFAREIGLPAKNYDDILIDDDDVASGDFTHVLTNICAIADAKREEMRVALQKLQSISRLERELLVASSHELNGPCFTMFFEAQECALCFDADGASREENEIGFYQNYQALVPWLTRRVGRLWSTSDIRADHVKECGYFIGLEDSCNAWLPREKFPKTDICTIKPGKYECFLVAGVFNKDSWSSCRQYIEDRVGSNDLQIIGHELGFYRSYSNMEHVVHLVRLVPLKNIDKHHAVM